MALTRHCPSRTTVEPKTPESTKRVGGLYRVLGLKQLSAARRYTVHIRVVLWYALLGQKVGAMKTMYREVSQPALPSCQQHNRLYPPYTVGGLTPARPEVLSTLQALCDICKEIACTLAPNSASKRARVLKAR